MMENERSAVVEAKTSGGIIALGLDYASQEGIEPLAPGERRPIGWVTASHETGHSDVRAAARENAPA